MKLPFQEIKVSDATVIRTFKQETDSEDFMWHRDLSDRHVIAISKTDWQIQLDNKLPETLSQVFIPKGEWHRIIKGTGDLTIKIIETS